MVQSINDVIITDIALNKFRCDAIRLGTIYVYFVTQNEIPETIL